MSSETSSGCRVVSCAERRADDAQAFVMALLRMLTVLRSSPTRKRDITPWEIRALRSVRNRECRRISAGGLPVCGSRQWLNESLSECRGGAVPFGPSSTASGSDTVAGPTPRLAPSEPRPPLGPCSRAFGRIGPSIPPTATPGIPRIPRVGGRVRLYRRRPIVAFVSHCTPDQTQSGDQVCKQFQTLL
jgi:hypothetical protein